MAEPTLEAGHEVPPPAHIMAKNDVTEHVAKPSQLSIEDEEMAVELANYVPNTVEEKRLVRKVDLILLPCLWWMYVLAYLDRGNIVSPALDKRQYSNTERTLGKCQCCWYE